MKILVIGKGGREHALAWKLAQEAEVWVTPGNPLISKEIPCFDVKETDFAGLIALCGRLQPDLIVVGPEDPLVNGLADFLTKDGFNVFGPRQGGASLEGSKAFSKLVMIEAGVPTAESGTFRDAELAADYARARFDAGKQVVVKASGNALGKGVIVCSTLDEAEDAIGAMLVERAFGEAGDEIVIEDRLIGREFSLLTVVGDHGFYSLPVAQDYKRALDNDRGPNTGGMGTYSPCDWAQPCVEQVEKSIVAPTVNWLRSRGMEYRGVLFSGIMVQDGQPYCLEFNVRFGDPETQSVLRRIGPGFANLLLESATGKPLTPVPILQNAAVSVVLASQGYPGRIAKGKPITIGKMPEGVKVFGSGIGDQNGQLVTDGGRVITISAEAKTVEEARKLAYLAAESIDFEGKQFRSDIAAV